MIFTLGRGGGRRGRLLLYSIGFLLLAAGGALQAQRPLLSPPIRQPADSSWPITWKSTAGSNSRLERSHDLASWSDVATLTATGPSTSAVDPEVPSQKKTFWRVVVLSNGPDTQPPVVSIIQARLIQSNGSPALELIVRAEDNVSVVGVSYSESGIALGAATAGPNQTWKRIVPVDSGTNPRRFQAQASDAAGNVGFSEVFNYVNTPMPSGLVPIGATGSPVAQGILGQRADGGLLPFVFLPDNNGGGAPESAAQ